MESPIDDDDEDGPMPLVDTFYTLARCSTCHNISLLFTTDLDEDSSDLGQATVLYPHSKIALWELPNNIRITYAEARKVRLTSTAAFVMLGRRVIEMICIDKGELEGPLAKRLENLATKEVIPKQLVVAAQMIRILGNSGAHDELFTVKKSDCQTLEELIAVIIEFIYIAPKRIEKLQKSMVGKTGTPSVM